jgi:uncharacterized protein
MRSDRRLVDNAEKRAMFEAMTSRYFHGRTAGRDYAPASAADLAATAVIEVQIEEFTAKMREGGPKGPNDAAEDAPGTRGVVDLRGNGE